MLNKYKEIEKRKLSFHSDTEYYSTLHMQIQIVCEY